MSITPAPMSMQFLTDKPDRGAILPQVLGGTCIAISVETSMRARVGTLISSELYKSYPAASKVLRVGAYPFGVSN